MASYWNGAAAAAEQAPAAVPAPAPAPPPAPPISLTLREGATRQERLAWILWQNRDALSYYVRLGVAQMPPILAGLLKTAGHWLKVDVETQFAPALVAYLYHMPPEEFAVMWLELEKIIRWAAAGPLLPAPPSPAESATDQTATPAPRAPAAPQSAEVTNDGTE